MMIDGVDLTDRIKVKRNVEGRGILGNEVTLLQVPGKAGGYTRKIEKPIRELQVPFSVHASSIEELREQAMWLSNFFDYREPKRIIFPDEPNYHYWGILDGTPNWEEVASRGDGVLHFLCADPYKYGPEKPQEFVNGVATVTNQGTAPAKPIFDISVKEDVTFLQLAKDTGEYMQIGYPVTTSDIVVDPKPTVLDQGMEGFDGWSTTNLLDPDEGTVGGNFASDSTLWFPQRYGDNTDGWHGPMMRYDLPQPLDDFQIDVLWRMNIYQNRANRMGLTEFYLVGTNNKIIGKFSIDESNLHDANVKVNAEIRNDERSQKLLNNVHGYRRGSYNNFFGRVHLFRNGGYHWAQVGERQDDGSYANRSNGRYRDADNEFSDVALQSILVYAAQYKDRMPPDHQYIHHIKAFALNDPQAGEVPYIAKVGDTMTINHQNGEILINGENNEDLKDFGANYFALEKGDNSLYAFPEDAFDITAKHQDRYL